MVHCDVRDLQTREGPGVGWFWAAILRPVAFDPVLVLRHPSIAASRTRLGYRRQHSWPHRCALLVPGSDAVMDTERRIRLWSLVVEHARGGRPALEHLCDAVISAVNVEGAAIVAVASSTPRETLAASDALASLLEELALTLGEGPGVDALVGDMVLTADTNGPDCMARWPVFAPAAARAGVRAVFALPMQVGGIRLGVLDLYRIRPGGLGGAELADALMLADMACALLLDMADRPSGHSSEGGPEPVAGQHPVVHQATGMLIVQLGVSAAVAMARLRAHAYANDRRLRDVAADVVARRLRLDSDGEAERL
jgi:ANTAR domain